MNGWDFITIKYDKNNIPLIKILLHCDTQIFGNSYTTPLTKIIHIFLTHIYVIKKLYMQFMQDLMKTLHHEIHFT